jgi:hypothetical protein
VTAAFDAQQQIWQLGDIRRNPPRVVFTPSSYVKSCSTSLLAGGWLWGQHLRIRSVRIAYRASSICCTSDVCSAERRLESFAGPKLAGKFYQSV